MEASLVEYFELEKTAGTKQDNSSSTEDSTLKDSSSLSEEDVSADESASSDNSTPLTDADPRESDSPTENEAETSDLQEKSDYAYVAEGADSYTAPEQAEINEIDGEEKPPEEVNQDTE